ncbi:MAG: DUF4299 family protein [Clostridia bacterium]|nr:DUF4299 family protein [Clostridia bacterium]
MSVRIEIRTTPEALRDLTIESIAGLCDLGYGISDNAYVLAQGETGKFNILFSSAPIGRGMEVSLEERKVVIGLPLPNTPHDIELCYRLAGELCKKLKLETFHRDGEEIPYTQSASLITVDLQASLNALRNMEQQIRSGEQSALSVFGALNPIVLGIPEFDAIGDTLYGFQDLLDRLQQMDAYYTVPRFFRLEGGPVVGMYFLAEDLTAVMAHDPVPAYQKVEGVSGYYVRIPGQYDIPYADFMAHAEHIGRYDAAHDLVRLTADTCALLAAQYAVDLRTGQRPHME